MKGAHCAWGRVIACTIGYLRTRDFYFLRTMQTQIFERDIYCLFIKVIWVPNIFLWNAERQKTYKMLEYHTAMSITVLLEIEKRRFKVIWSSQMWTWMKTEHADRTQRLDKPRHSTTHNSQFAHLIFGRLNASANANLSLDTSWRPRPPPASTNQPMKEPNLIHRVIAWNTQWYVSANLLVQ